MALLGVLGLWWPGWMAAVAVAPLLWPARARQVLRLWLGQRFPAAVLVFIGVAACGALSPNTHTDVESYHYTLPRLYLQHHGLYWTDTSTFDGSFQLVHMLYGLAMAVGGEVQANLLGPIFLGLLALATAVACGRRQAGVLAALLLVSSPVAFEQATGGLIDVPCAAFAMLAMDAWLLASRARRPAGWGWCGWFAGAAAGVRSTGGLAALVLCLLTLRFRSTPWDRIWPGGCPTRPRWRSGPIPGPGKTPSTPCLSRGGACFPYGLQVGCSVPHRRGCS
jgi:hypothetical protein